MYKMYTLALSLPLLLLMNGVSAIRLVDNAETFEKVMSHQMVKLKDGTRSHRPHRLHNIPFNHSVHSSLSSCPSQCEERRGDGFCDPACNTGPCLMDFGDCDSAPYCSDHSCPGDECGWDCALSGCQVGSCQLNQGGRREFFWAVLPKANPYKIFEHFHLSELCMEAQLGFPIYLQSDKAGPMLFGRRRGNKSPTRLKFDSVAMQMRFVSSAGSYYAIKKEDEIDEHGALALFSINSTRIVSTVDTLVMRSLRRLGGSRIQSKIIPFTLTKEEREAFFLPDMDTEAGLLWTRFQREAIGSKAKQRAAEKCRYQEEYHGRMRRDVVEEEYEEEEEEDQF